MSIISVFLSIFGHIILLSAPISCLQADQRHATQKSPVESVNTTFVGSADVGRNNTMDALPEDLNVPEDIGAPASNSTKVNGKHEAISRSAHFNIPHSNNGNSTHLTKTRNGEEDTSLNETLTNATDFGNATSIPFQNNSTQPEPFQTHKDVTLSPLRTDCPSKTVCQPCEAYIDCFGSTKEIHGLFSKNESDTEGTEFGKNENSTSGSSVVDRPPDADVAHIAEPKGLLVEIQLTKSAKPNKTTTRPKGVHSSEIPEVNAAVLPESDQTRSTSNDTESDHCSSVPPVCSKCLSCLESSSTHTLMSPLDDDFDNSTNAELMLGPGMEEFPKGLCKRVGTVCKYNWDCCGAAKCEITDPVLNRGSCVCGPAPDVNGCTGGITGPLGATGIPPPKQGDYGVCFLPGQKGCGSSFDCCGGFEIGGNGDRYTSQCAGDTFCSSAEGLDNSTLAFNPNMGVKRETKQGVSLTRHQKLGHLRQRL
eukprot:Filipodium_phascolosomae@DN599_c0_g1_i1.p1